MSYDDDMLILPSAASRSTDEKTRRDGRDVADGLPRSVEDCAAGRDDDEGVLRVEVS